MSKIKRIFNILFGNEIKIDSNIQTEEIGFGPIATQDNRLDFDKEVIKKELQCPPVKIEIEKLNIKIIEVKRIIASLKKKKMDISIYQEALVHLINRKSYTSDIENHLSTYPITNRNKIEELSTKYKLVFRNLNGITRDIPLGAVKAIDTFFTPLEKAKISFDKNNLFLIAPEDWWRKKRDPILLCKSPFGNYYYILYVWDKEVNIISELYE
jgi:hypothetical protein